MANNPKKVKDPTEVALSAIQEALNISDAAEDETPRNPIRLDIPAQPPASASTTAFNDSAFDTRPGSEGPSFEPAEEPRPVRRAANDDRETIGQILQAIQKGRPARNIYLLATLFAGIWILGAALLTYSFLPSLETAMGQGGGQSYGPRQPGARSAVLGPEGEDPGLVRAGLLAETGRPHLGAEAQVQGPGRAPSGRGQQEKGQASQAHGLAL